MRYTWVPIPFLLHWIESVEMKNVCTPDVFSPNQFILNCVCVCFFSGRMTRVWIHWTLVFILHRVGMATAMAATYTGKMRKTWHFHHHRESLLQNRSHKRVKWHFCVKLFVPRSSSKGEKYIRILHVHKIKTILHSFQNCCYDAVGVRLLCVVGRWLVKMVVAHRTLCAWMCLFTEWKTKWPNHRRHLTKRT